MTAIVQPTEEDWKSILNWVVLMRPGGGIFEHDWRVTQEVDRKEIALLAEWHQRLSARLHRYGDALEVREKSYFAVFGSKEMEPILRIETAAIFADLELSETDCGSLSPRVERDRMETFTAFVRGLKRDGDKAADVRWRAMCAWSDAVRLRLMLKAKSRGGARPNIIAHIVAPFMVKHGVGPRTMLKRLRNTRLRDLPSEKTLQEAKRLAAKLARAKTP